MTEKKNIVRGFVAIAAIAFVMVGCEKDEFNSLDGDSTELIVKDGRSGDVNWGDPITGDDPIDPAGINGRNDSILLNSSGGAYADPTFTPYVPLNRIKDDKVRDGSDNEEDDDGEDDGGRQSSMSGN